jgi:hypothetical protein
LAPKGSRGFRRGLITGSTLPAAPRRAARKPHPDYPPQGAYCHACRGTGAPGGARVFG